MAGPLATRTIAQFVIVTLIWGSTWLVIKTQLGVVPPSWSVSYRFAVAGVGMLLYCLLTGKSLRLGPKGHGFAAVLALFQFVLNFNFVYRAEQHVTSGLVAVAFALLVVPNAALGWMFLRQRITGRFALGSALGITGVGMLFWHELSVPGGNGAVELGLLLTTLGILCASVGNVMQATQLGRRLPLHGTLGMALSYAALMNAAVACALSGPPVFDPRPAYVAGVVYLGIIASAVAFNLYFDMIRAMGPARAAYSSVLIPLIAMLLSTIFESYRWTALAVAGSVLALSGLVLALGAKRG